jgi:drug/metabolite transporter (DMT)-like permease
MVAFIFAILSLFSSAIAWFFAARASKDMGSLRSLFIFQLIGIPFFLFLLPWAPDQISLANSWLPIMSVGIFETFVMLLLFHALKIGNVSVVIPITDGYAVITAILGFVFLHELITFGRLLGGILIVSGLSLISMKISQSNNLKLVNFNRGAIPAILAAIGTGIFFFAVGVTVRGSNWFVTSLGIRIAISLTAIILLLLKKDSLKGLWKDTSWKWILPAAALDVFGFSFYNIAVSKGDISYVTLIASPQSLITVLLGYIILKEKVSKIQWFGVLLALSGLVSLQI